MQRLGGALLRLIGWRLVLAPAPPKSVIMVYPHTSNWDFVIGMFARWEANLKIYWAGKDTLFMWPFAGLLKRLGGIPVNRRERTGFTAHMAAEFARREAFLLVIAPEGTRKRTEYLRSGFYRLAVAAKVPLGFAFFDYARREVGIAAYVDLSGDEARDLATIAAFYSDKRACRPEKAGGLRFRPNSET
ncbi:MAG: glycerol acyltransferase [Burkholderiales bacterium]|nr:MAG: glycerol acyltransferase [Burkholderiales bacterium]CAG1010182.1 1-acyl-sn-glycerol-3-phosphate acyltransferase [Myxococcaceae bacterium]